MQSRTKLNQSVPRHVVERWAISGLVVLLRLIT